MRRGSDECGAIAANSPTVPAASLLLLLCFFTKPLPPQRHTKKKPYQNPPPPPADQLKKAHKSSQSLSQKLFPQTQPTTPYLIPQKIHKRIIFQYPFSHKRTQQKGIVLSSHCLSASSPRIAHSSRSSKNLKRNIGFSREDDVGLGLEDAAGKDLKPSAIQCTFLLFF